MKTKHPKNINEWCPHFAPLGTIIKTNAKKHLDCLDCAKHNYDCPYEYDSKEEKGKIK